MMFKQESKSSSQTPESSGLDQKEPDGPHSHEKKESEAMLHGQWHQLLNTQDYVLKFSINELRLEQGIKESIWNLQFRWYIKAGSSSWD